MGSSGKAVPRMRSLILVLLGFLLLGSNSSVFAQGDEDGDSDDDGVLDTADEDDDNDGVEDAGDTDDDGDNISDEEEDDNDGFANSDDPDDDGDGIMDAAEDDEDGLHDDVDQDDDNDGLLIQRIMMMMVTISLIMRKMRMGMVYLMKMTKTMMETVLWTRTNFNL